MIIPVLIFLPVLMPIGFRTIGVCVCTLRQCRHTLTFCLVAYGTLTNGVLTFTAPSDTQPIIAYAGPGPAGKITYARQIKAC